MKNAIHILTILFHNKIALKAIPFFRGAVINALQGEENILFHNHQSEGKFRYAYPLIQYKCIHGQAAIVCIKEGTEAIGHFFANASLDFEIGNERMVMELDAVKPQQHIVQVWNTEFKYRLRRWLPLNTENYKIYTELESLGEKVHLLEKVLIANLLSFTKGVGLYMEQEVKCKLTFLGEPFIIVHKGVKLMAFDVEFLSNVSIPDYIGLGKNASMGCGVVTKVADRKNER